MTGSRYGWYTCEDAGTRKGVSAGTLCARDMLKYRAPRRRRVSVVRSRYGKYTSGGTERMRGLCRAHIMRGKCSRCDNSPKRF